MTGVSVSIVLVVLLGIKGSLQLEDCEISSGRLRGSHRGSLLTAAPNCSDGFISWHYPQGSLDVVFPITTLSTNRSSRRPPRMRVCFRGRDLGDSLTSITQHVTSRRGQNSTREIELAQEDSETSWVCSRSSRPRGNNTGVVHVVFGAAAAAQGMPDVYKAIIHYKVEEARCCRHGGRRGNRRGQSGRGQSGRGHRGGRHHGGGGHGRHHGRSHHGRGHRGGHEQQE